MLHFWKLALTAGTMGVAACWSAAASGQSLAPASAGATGGTLAALAAPPGLQLILASFAASQPGAFGAPSLAVNWGLSQALDSLNDTDSVSTGSTAILPGAFGQTGVTTGVYGGRGVGGRNPYARRNSNARPPTNNGRRGGGGGTGGHGGGGHGGGRGHLSVPHTPSAGQLRR